MQKIHSDEHLKELHRALITISHSVRGLHKILHLQTELDLEMFQQVLDSKLIVQLNPDYPLMVAITGGGSTGKSSLFNALMGREISAVKARAGYSRRVLAGMHPSVRAKEDFFQSLFSAFGALPEQLKSADELTTPGIPKYVECDQVPANMVLLDTPDFDTGDRESFTNRGLAKPILEACDVLVYIFTGATYNNRENTGFIRQVLTSVGNRKVALVYRCSRTYSEDEVVEHAETVARNLYGDQFKKNLVGIYRVNEDDAVASGQSLMAVRPVAGFPQFSEMLASLDRSQTRADFIKTALRDVRRDAQVTLDSSSFTRMQLELYGDAVRVATSWAATEALKAFPNEAVLKRLLEIWDENAPTSKKILRKAGKIVAAPGRLAVKGFRFVLRRSAPVEPPKESVDTQRVFRENLQLSANTLRIKLIGEDITVKAARRNQECRHMIELVEGMRSLALEKVRLPIIEELNDSLVNIRIPRPAVLEAAKLMKDSALWKQTLLHLCEETSEMEELSNQIDQELIALAQEFRGQMGAWSKTRELLTASLPVLTGVGAVAYVLGTGDFVGGATIQAKIIALFGLNDLVALAAIPIGTGLDQVHRNALVRLLGPIYESWLNERIEKIRNVLREHVSGAMIDAVGEVLCESQKPFEELAAAIQQLPKGDSNE